MIKRPKIAIFIDYSLRVPNFNKAYSHFKNAIFNNKENEYDIDKEAIDDEEDIKEGGERLEENIIPDAFRFFWSKELENPDVETFYAKKNVITEDYDLKNSDFKEYFFNEAHWMKFMEDYSFNLYGDAELPYKKDVDLLNIAQTYLFDVILIDEFYTTRKKSNTFFYLSKIRITPQGVLFLGLGQQIDESIYLGVWNPKKYSEQVNKEGFGDFEIWLKDLEQQIKNNI